MTLREFIKTLASEDMMSQFINLDQELPDTGGEWVRFSFELKFSPKASLKEKPELEGVGFYQELKSSK